MKKRLVIGVILVFALLTCSCKKNDDIKDLENANVVTQQEAETDTESEDAGDQIPEIDKDATVIEKDDVTVGGLSAEECKEAYLAFLNNEKEVYFDKEWIDNSYTWMYYAINAVNSGCDSVTFEELISKYVAELEEFYPGAVIDIKDISYSFIDCGNDGIPELAIMFDDLFIGETMYFDDIIIIKLMEDGKLQFCFFTESGYRTITSLNQYGYYVYSSYSGFSNYNLYQVIDKNGDLARYYSVDTYYVPSDVSYDNYEELDKLATTLGVEQMVVEGFMFEDTYEDTTQEEINAAMMWTYFENESCIYNDDVVQDESILQDGSNYKTFWDATGLSLNSYKEIQATIKEREKELEITDEIKSAEEISWTKLTDDQIKIIYPGKPVTEESDSNTPQLSNQAVELVIDNPSWEYYNYTQEAASDLTIKLEKTSEQSNDIIDEYEWFGKIGIDPYELNYFSDNNYYYELRTTGDYSPYMVDIYDKNTDELKVTLNMCKFYYPDEYVAEDVSYIGEGIRWAQSSYNGDVIYVCTSHRTYAESAPANAFITAIQLNDTFDDYTVLWRSEPLVANANNFIVYGDYIICGYGFTAEPDFIYILDKYTGVKLATYPVKTGPDYFYADGNKLYVRTYNTDYEYDIKEQ